jgi:MFS family permease
MADSVAQEAGVPMPAAAAAAAAQIAPVPHPLRDRTFRVWWTGTAVSLFGDQFYLVALPWLVLDLTGSAIALGGILTAAALPRVLLMLVGGAVSDRLSPRRIMIATASVRTACVSVMAMLVWLRALQIWHLYALSFIFGVADAFVVPAFQALLPSLVRREQLPAANAAVQGVYHFSTITGPAPAGALIRSLGIAWALLLDAISFLFVIGALLVVPDPPRAVSSLPKPSLWQSIRDGLRYVNADVPLRALVMLVSVMNVSVSGAMFVGLVSLAKVRYGSPAAYGIWLSAVAAGDLTGTILAGLRRPHQRGRLLLGLAAAFGVCLLLLPWLQFLWLTAAVLTIMGTMNGLVYVQTTAWIQQRVDRALLGRVTSVYMCATYGLTPVSLALAGVLAQWNVTALFLAAGALLLLTTGLAALHPPVRQID